MTNPTAVAAPKYHAPLAWAEVVETPAFVLEERAVRRALATADRIRHETGARILYALKPLAHRGALRWLREGVDGFAASSLFEARLARELLDPGQTLSITTPGFREHDIDRIAALCDHVVLNSLPQWERFGARLFGRTSVGLRVNPGLSFVSDERYNPCRTDSKLGAPIHLLAEAMQVTQPAFAGLEGLHFHTNCESESFEPLLQTVCLIVETLDPLLRSLRWINLGGGYRFLGADRLSPLYQAIRLLRQRYGLTVFLEPGAALVREAGYLITEVIDLFSTGGATIAVLDTSVNHLPEVFEYQLRPEVIGDSYEYSFRYLLAGATCLSGDLFGEYRFAQPLQIGSRLIIPNVGAYTLVKAHTFNGINLPALYTASHSGALQLQRRFTYDDYLHRLALEEQP